MKLYPMTFGPVSLLVAGFITAGCDTVNTVERQRPTATPDYVDTRQVETDSELAEIAKVVSVRQATVSDNLLKVEVDLYNSDTDTRRVNYKFEWFDQAGMQVDTPLSTWQHKILLAKETITFSAVAPTPKAKDFRLKLQISQGD